MADEGHITEGNLGISMGGSSGRDGSSSSGRSRMDQRIRQCLSVEELSQLVMSMGAAMGPAAALKAIMQVGGHHDSWNQLATCLDSFCADCRGMTMF